MNELESGNHIESADARNVEIQYGELWRVYAGHLDSALAVIGLDHLFNAKQLHELHFDDHAKRRMVVDNQNS
jgi:hypothetical protein